MRGSPSQGVLNQEIVYRTDGARNSSFTMWWPMVMAMLLSKAIVGLSLVMGHAGHTVLATLPIQALVAHA